MSKAPSTLRQKNLTYPSGKRSFSKSSSNRKNLETSTFRYHADIQPHDNHVISLPKFFSNINPK